VIAQTRIHLHDAATGTEIPLPPPGDPALGFRTFIGWNPDATLVFEGFSSSKSLHVSSFPGFQPITRIYGGMRSIDPFGTEAFYDFEKSRQDRWRIGRLVFAGEATQPICALPGFAPLRRMSTPLLQSIETPGGEAEAIPLTMADRYLAAHLKTRPGR